MVKKEKIRRQVLKIYAGAEIVLRTEKANKILQKHLNGGCCEVFAEELIYDDLRKTYTGCESAETLGVDVYFKPFTLSFKETEDMFGVQISPIETIDSVVERCFQSLKQKAVDAMREDIAQWGISVRELFPEEQSHSIH